MAGHVSAIVVGPCPMNAHSPLGDVDEGGFRIASVLAKASADAGHALMPHAMTPAHVHMKMRKPASKRPLTRMKHFAESAGRATLGEELIEAGFIVEQEAL